jgi:hypothetical protein
MLRTASLLALAFALAACAPVRAGPETVVPKAASGNWHRIATDPDRARLSKWRKTWVKAVEAARADGHGSEIAEAGPLLDPDSGMEDPAIPPGLYRCRTLKLGARAKGNLTYVAYPAFSCRVGAPEAHATLPFARLDGSQRPIGRIFPDTTRRMVFLGTLQLGDEQGSLRYGHDAERDMIGALQRVGPSRWRIALPSPAFESLLDVIELVPAS